MTGQVEHSTFSVRLPGLPLMLDGNPPLVYTGRIERAHSPGGSRIAIEVRAPVLFLGLLGLWLGFLTLVAMILMGPFGLLAPPLAIGLGVALLRADAEGARRLRTLIEQTVSPTAPTVVQSPPPEDPQP